MQPAASLGAGNPGVREDGGGGPIPPQRPQSLADIPAFREEGIPFGIAIREFLDTFNALSSAARPAALASCPALLRGRVPDGAMNDAYLAAVAEKLARDHDLGPPPEWVFAPERFLADPWFAAAAFPGLRPLLLMESPVSFRRRNLFISANGLERA